MSEKWYFYIREGGHKIWNFSKIPPPKFHKYFTFFTPALKASLMSECAHAIHGRNVGTVSLSLSLSQRVSLAPAFVLSQCWQNQASQAGHVIMSSWTLTNLTVFNQKSVSISCECLLMADRYAPSHETLQILKSTKLAPETFLGYQNKNEDISCCIFSPIHKNVPLLSCEGLLLPAGSEQWGTQWQGQQGIASQLASLIQHGALVLQTDGGRHVRGDGGSPEHLLQPPSSWQPIGTCGGRFSRQSSIMSSSSSVTIPLLSQR